MSDELRLAVFRRDDFSCGHCGLWLLNEIPEDYDGHYAPRGFNDDGQLCWLEIDHLFPVSAGGGDEPDNLQVLCHLCNRRKGTSLEDWEDRMAMYEAIAEIRAERAEDLRLRASPV